MYNTASDNIMAVSRLYLSVSNYQHKLFTPIEIPVGEIIYLNEYKTAFFHEDKYLTSQVRYAIHLQSAL